MVSTNKIPNQLKLKIIFLFIFSHISAYLLYLPSSDNDVDLTKYSPITRHDHTEISISAALKTSFAIDKAITILSKDKKLLIPHAFLIERQTEENDLDFSTKTNNESYLVSIPTKLIEKIINRKGLIILPFGRYKFTSKKKRMNYEIVL